MRKIYGISIGLLMVCLLASCGTQKKQQTTKNSELEQGVSAIEDAMKAENTDGTEDEGEGNTRDMEDVGEGTSAETIATPEDFPDAYDYGTGKIQDYKRTDMLRKMPEPKENDTVLHTTVDPESIQALYLWENIGMKDTAYTDNADKCVCS